MAYFGRYRHYQMDVVWLDVQFQHFHVFLLTQQLIDLLPSILCYLFAKDAIPVLWTKHDVVLTLIDGVRESFESLAHDVSP